MKRLIFAFIIVITFALLINSCKESRTASKPEIEGNINTQASTDEFADIGNK